MIAAAPPWVIAQVTRDLTKADMNQRHVDAPFRARVQAVHGRSAASLGAAVPRPASQGDAPHAGAAARRRRVALRIRRSETTSRAHSPGKFARVHASGAAACENVLSLLLLIFAGCAAAIWFAGIRLADITDTLAMRFGFGEAFGGLIVLALVTNLPEIAITVSAALHHDLELAIGNILGGIAMQTVVLVVLDEFGLGSSDPLTYRAASLVLVLEGLMVIAVLTLVVIGSQFEASVIYLGVSPVDATIVLVWLVGLYGIGKARTNLPWHERGAAPGGQKEPRGHSIKKKFEAATKKGLRTPRLIAVFVFCCIVTLVAGVGLEVSGEAIARLTGMTGVLFGATVLAAATSLPEVSTGLAAMKLRDTKWPWAISLEAMRSCRCCCWRPRLCQGSLFFIKGNEPMSMTRELWEFPVYVPSTSLRTHFASAETDSSNGDGFIHRVAGVFVGRGGPFCHCSSRSAVALTRLAPPGPPSPAESPSGLGPKQDSNPPKPVQRRFQLVVGYIHASVQSRATASVS